MADRLIGDVGGHGAVFVYKADGTEDVGWDGIQEVRENTRNPYIRGEVHSQRDEFLDALSTWCGTVNDPNGAFLCINAHMGVVGLSCVDYVDCRAVTWTELAETLCPGVAVLWLLGCNSEECMQSWDPLSSPVETYLLATSDSAYFQPMISAFSIEVGTDPIKFFDEMPGALREHNRRLAEATRYWKPTADGFDPAFQ